MKTPTRYRLSEAEKDALLMEQAALIERMAARISELEAALRHTIETPGYIFGLTPVGPIAGAGQLGRTAQYIHDVWTGSDNPQGAADFLRGLIYGPRPKKSAASAPAAGGTTIYGQHRPPSLPWAQ